MRQFVNEELEDRNRQNRRRPLYPVQRVPAMRERSTNSRRDRRRGKNREDPRSRSAMRTKSANTPAIKHRGEGRHGVGTLQDKAEAVRQRIASED